MLTPRGSYGKLNAIGTPAGQVARNSNYFRAASIFKRRGLFQFRPYSVFSVFLADAPTDAGGFFFRPSNWTLARGDTMPQKYRTCTKSHNTVKLSVNIDRIIFDEFIGESIKQKRLPFQQLEHILENRYRDQRREKLNALLEEIC